MEKKKTAIERTSLILVDCTSNFTHHLSSTGKVYEIEDYGDGLVLTMWPFKRVAIKSEPELGENMVALYEKHFDGFGMIKRWNYIEKGQKSGD